MFKKIRYENGQREIYFGKRKIFQYLNKSKFAEFIRNKLENLNHIDWILHNKLNSLISSQMLLAKDKKDILLILGQSLYPTYPAPQVARNTDNIFRFLNLLRPYTSPDLELVRVGGVGDGGYCMLCPSKITPPPPYHNKIKALSLGVSPYSPWDLEMANKGYEVLEFDASIDKSPYPHHPNIKFFKQFVGAKDSIDNGVETIALERIIKDFDFDENTPNILQCDIENAEWEILERIDIGLLDKYFSQLIFEFHKCNPDDDAGSQMRFKILEKINKYFVPIWVHYNSYSGLMISDDILFCSTIEVSYIRKDLLPANAEVFGGGLFRLGIDTSNNLQIPDIPVVFP